MAELSGITGSVHDGTLEWEGQTTSAHDPGSVRVTFWTRLDVAGAEGLTTEHARSMAVYVALLAEHERATKRQKPLSPPASPVTLPTRAQPSDWPALVVVFVLAFIALYFLSTQT